MITLEITRDGHQYNYVVKEDGKVTEGTIIDRFESCPASILIQRVGNDMAGKQNAKAYDNFDLAKARLEQVEAERDLLQIQIDGKIQIGIDKAS